MKRIVSIFLTVVLMFSLCQTVFAKDGTNYEAETTNLDLSPKVDLDVSAKSVCLIEASTGEILYSENECEEYSPASVTKVMTLLLVCEALEVGSITLDQKVTVSSTAAAMGGSQVFLEEGEAFTVEELIKCTVIASANDAAVALSELIAGSESAFATKMNDKAKEMGLENTAFENATGLDDETVSHYSSAKDIALMSRELIKYDIITKYSGIWQDSIRDGEFILTNTNRLVRYYEGCNGLKTGSTDKAGFCVSASAKRTNMQLIAVVMGAQSRDKRNEDARMLLDYGFSTFALYEKGEEVVDLCPVYSGKIDEVELISSPVSFLVPRASVKSVEVIYELPEVVYAPITSDESVGRVVYKLGEEVLSVSTVYPSLTVEKLGVGEIFVRILKRITAG